MRVLVTGIGGFVGPHLTAALVAAGHEVHGFALEPAVVAGVTAVHVADLLDQEALARTVALVSPHAIVHLAAVSFVPAAEADPRQAVRVNVEGTTGLLQAVADRAPESRVLFVSSGDAYGAVGPDEIPIDEDVPLRPIGVYGATKAAAEVLALQWARRRGTRLVVARPFNHTGPGQSAEFVVPAFARQIARIERAEQEPVVRVGDLTPVRDVGDVRDVVRAYVALLDRGRPGTVYNVCAGRGVSIRELLDGLLALTDVRVRVETDPARRRPVDVPRIVGAHARLRAETGWQPEIPLVKTLTDVLAEWRGRIPG